MLCPKCNKEMKIMQILDLMIIEEGELNEFLGRCENCDFDATWETLVNPDGETHEFNFKQYFFG